jgi:hypothetical protein
VCELIFACITLLIHQRTFYGEYWEFGKKSEAESAVDESTNMEFHDTAYLDVGIGVHTDGTYWTVPPGIQVNKFFSRKSTSRLLLQHFF